MQKGLIIVLFSMLCFSSKAQQIFVNGQNLTTLKNISYIIVKVEKTWIATRFSAFLDYGQGTSDRQQEMTGATQKHYFYFAYISEQKVKLIYFSIKFGLLFL